MTGDGEDMLSAVATGQIIVQFRHGKKAGAYHLHQFRDPVKNGAN